MADMVPSGVLAGQTAADTAPGRAEFFSCPESGQRSGLEFELLTAPEKDGLLWLRIRTAESTSVRSGYPEASTTTPEFSSKSGGVADETLQELLRTPEISWRQMSWGHFTPFRGSTSLHSTMCNLGRRLPKLLFVGNGISTFRSDRVP